MQGIYTYIPETNHVPREYSVSGILSLLFMVSISLVPALALLYFYVSTFRSMCAVPNMAVFCSSFTSYYYYYYHHHPCYSLYARYLQLRTWNKPRFKATQCYSCSVCTVCATCNVISPVTLALYLYTSTSRSLCAVHNMAVLCTSLISCFPVVLLRHRVGDSETVPVAPVSAGNNRAVILRMRWISIMRPSCFKMFSVTLLSTVLSAGIATLSSSYYTTLCLSCGTLPSRLATVNQYQQFPRMHHAQNLSCW